MNKTFWQLINDYKIVIPILQRDYAQGRKNDKAIEQIRTSLVDALYDALEQQKTIVLNYIYGEENGQKFIPIDGQQRLTTLFLLHWFVFAIAGNTQALKILSGFTYETRHTSSRFCGKLCECAWKFTDGIKISEQIKNNSWFTGSFAQDPTISSMLVMIDCISERITNEKCIQYSEMLMADDCPISFLWLSMKNFQQTEDLYIKMNARGKLLTDFEIFKAKLQNSSILNEMLSPLGEDQITYISRFNNEFAELFYEKFNQRFDMAMMNFIKEIIRDDYFCYISGKGVPQKDYRNDYRTIQRMNGSMFYRFISNNGFKYDQFPPNEARSTIKKSIEKIANLLEMFCNLNDLKITKNSNKDYYDENDLFKSIVTPNIEKSIIRYALYEYINRTGVPDDTASIDAYTMWTRFVYNIVTNSDIAGRVEDACDAMSFFRSIIDIIDDYTEDGVLHAVINSQKISAPGDLKSQHKEEIKKAELMESCQKWKKAILDVEEYFVDGQIKFLIDYSCENNECNVEKFKYYFNKAKIIFDEKKYVKPSCDNNLFKKALLCMPDSTHNKTSFLLKQSNSSTTWGFYKSNYARLLSNKTEEDKREIIKALLNVLTSEDNVNIILQGIVENVNTGNFDEKEVWKKYFIEHDLFDEWMAGSRFANCIHLADNNKTVLLLTGTTARAYSMEINTYLLYKELNKGELVLSTTSYLEDANGFPLRYIKYKAYCIGYKCVCDNKPYIMKDSTDVQQYSYDEIMQILSEKL